MCLWNFVRFQCKTDDAILNSSSGMQQDTSVNSSEPDIELQSLWTALQRQFYWQGFSTKLVPKSGSNPVPLSNVAPMMAQHLHQWWRNMMRQLLEADDVSRRIQKQLCNFQKKFHKNHLHVTCISSAHLGIKHFVLRKKTLPAKSVVLLLSVIIALLCLSTGGAKGNSSLVHGQSQTTAQSPTRPALKILNWITKTLAENLYSAGKLQLLWVDSNKNTVNQVLSRNSPAFGMLVGVDVEVLSHQRRCLREVSAVTRRGSRKDFSVTCGHVSATSQRHPLVMWQLHCLEDAGMSLRGLLIYEDVSARLPAVTEMLWRHLQWVYAFCAAKLPQLL